MSLLDNMRLVDLLLSPRDTIRKIMEAEVVASSFSVSAEPDDYLDALPSLECPPSPASLDSSFTNLISMDELSGAVQAQQHSEDILRPNRASMDLLLHTDTAIMNRVRTVSTSHMDESLSLIDTSGSILDQMLANEEMMSANDPWVTSTIADVIQLDLTTLGKTSALNSAPVTSTYSATSLLTSNNNLPKVPVSAGTSLLKQSLIAPKTMKTVSKHKNNGGGKMAAISASPAATPEVTSLSLAPTPPPSSASSSSQSLHEDDFNVLHLDDNSVVALDNLPLFSMDGDMNELLDQFEQDSEPSSSAVTSSAGTSQLSGHQREVVSIVKATDKDSKANAQQRSSSKQKPVRSNSEESPEVVKLLQRPSVIKPQTKAQVAALSKSGSPPTTPAGDKLKRSASTSRKSSIVTAPQPVSAHARRASSSTNQRAQSNKSGSAQIELRNQSAQGTAVLDKRSTSNTRVLVSQSVLQRTQHSTRASAVQPSQLRAPNPSIVTSQNGSTPRVHNTRSAVLNSTRAQAPPSSQPQTQHQQSQPVVHASKKLRKLLGHTPDSGSDSDKSIHQPPATAIVVNPKPQATHLHRQAVANKLTATLPGAQEDPSSYYDIKSVGTPETITAPSTPAAATGEAQENVSRCSTPDPQTSNVASNGKKKISLAMYKSTRLVGATASKKLSSESNTPLSSGRSSPVKSHEFVNNTQLIMDTVRAKLNAQISANKLSTDQTNNQGSASYYDVILDHDYCQRPALTGSAGSLSLNTSTSNSGQASPAKSRSLLNSRSNSPQFGASTSKAHGDIRNGSELEYKSKHPVTNPSNNEGYQGQKMLQDILAARPMRTVAQAERERYEERKRREKEKYKREKYEREKEKREREKRELEKRHQQRLRHMQASVTAKQSADKHAGYPQNALPAEHRPRVSDNRKIEHRTGQHVRKPMWSHPENDQTKAAHNNNPHGLVPQKGPKPPQAKTSELKDLLLNPGLQEEVKAQAVIDRQECMRRMSGEIDDRKSCGFENQQVVDMELDSDMENECRALLQGGSVNPVVAIEMPCQQTSNAVAMETAINLDSDQTKLLQDAAMDQTAIKNDNQYLPADLAHCDVSVPMETLVPEETHVAMESISDALPNNLRDVPLPDNSPPPKLPTDGTKTENQPVSRIDRGEGLFCNPENPVQPQTVILGDNNDDQQSSNLSSEHSDKSQLVGKDVNTQSDKSENAIIQPNSIKIERHSPENCDNTIQSLSDTQSTHKEVDLGNDFVISVRDSNVSDSNKLKNVESNESANVAGSVNVLNIKTEPEDSYIEPIAINNPNPLNLDMDAGKDSSHPVIKSEPNLPENCEPSEHKHNTRNKRRFRKRNKSPETTEPRFNKLPGYMTNLAIKPTAKVASKSMSTRLKTNSLPTHDRDPSPDRSDPVFNKVPAYLSCYTNSTKYDEDRYNSDPLRLDDDVEGGEEGEIEGGDIPLWTSSTSMGESSASEFKAEPPGSPTSLVIASQPASRDVTRNNSCVNSRANSRPNSHAGSAVNSRVNSRANSPQSRPRRIASRSYRRRSKSPTHSRSRSRSRSRSSRSVTRSTRGRKRSYSSSSRSSSRSYSRSRSRSSSRVRSRSRLRSPVRLRSRSRVQSRSPERYDRLKTERGRQTRKRKYDRFSRSRSTSAERFRQRKRMRRDEEKTAQMEERRIVYVGNISEHQTRAELRKAFSVFGQIEEANLHFREHGDNYGFLTFAYTCDAYAAIERGNKLPGCERYDLCFGGRRHFCKTEYADLDGNNEEEEEMRGSAPSQSNDFDELLRQALEKAKKKRK